MRGEQVINAHPAIRLFTLCEGFKWTLPSPGGIYDQDPVLMDKFQYMFLIRGQVQAELAEKREKEAKQQAQQQNRRPNPARPARRK